MAELHIEKKKKSPIGWIILGVIVLGLVIWFVASETNGVQQVANLGQDEERTSEYGQEQSQAVAPFERDRDRDREGVMDRDRGRTASDIRIQEFLVFVDERTDDMTSAKAREGLIKLSDALIAVSEQAEGQGAWQGELEQIKQQANRLQDNNLTQQHSAIIQSAFSSAANVIQDIQNRFYPGLEDDASDVMDAAQDIEAQELASEQESEIKSFFDEAADVVRKMDERRQTSAIQ